MHVVGECIYFLMPGFNKKNTTKPTKPCVFWGEEWGGSKKKHRKSWKALIFKTWFNHVAKNVQGKETNRTESQHPMTWDLGKLHQITILKFLKPECFRSFYGDFLTSINFFGGICSPDSGDVDFFLSPSSWSQPLWDEWSLGPRAVGCDHWGIGFQLTGNFSHLTWLTTTPLPISHCLTHVNWKNLYLTQTAWWFFCWTKSRSKKNLPSTIKSPFQAPQNDRCVISMQQIFTQFEIELQ